MRSPRTILKSLNMHAKKQLGQNFLADPSTAEMIVNRSNISEGDVVMEIGPGLGALTIPLARRANKLYAVEKDRDMIPILKTELLMTGLENVELINEDILRVDIESVWEKNRLPMVVMGNLPYNISSQVMIKLISSRKRVRRAVFMLQKELAERLCAEPGKKDYGRLSAVLQYCAEIRSVAEVKAHLFHPRPKVDSEVIEISFFENPEFPARDEEFLFAVIKAAFSKRRKTLKNALTRSELAVETALCNLALENAGIEPARRAETLGIEEFVKLSHALMDAGAGPASPA